MTKDQPKLIEINSFLAKDIFYQIRRPLLELSYWKKLKLLHTTISKRSKNLPKYARLKILNLNISQ